MNFRKRFKSNWKESKTDAGNGRKQASRARPQTTWGRESFIVELNVMLLPCFPPVFSVSLFQSMVKITIHYCTLHKQNQNYSSCCCHLTFLLNDSGIFDLYKWLRYTLPIQRVRCCDAYKWGRYVVSTHHLSTRSFLAIFASRAAEGKSRSKNAAAVPCFCLLRVDRMCNTVS